ncbi:MAG: hypothetical protein J1F18_07080 [Lachnospiraceae bacterium]|nr:hypothetical protein [Lachnospiraceae bacterium]
MKLKKILALLCCCALAVSLAVPVFAGTVAPTDGATIVYAGSPAKEGDADLTVAVSILYAMKKLYVNPYGLPFNIKTTKVLDSSGTATDETIYEETVTEGWFSNTAIIKNIAPSDLNVKVKISTDPKGNTRVVEDEADAANHTEYNCVYGTFEITEAKLVKDDDGKNQYKPTDWKLYNVSDGAQAGHKRFVPIRATGDPDTSLQDTEYTIVGAKTEETAMGWETTYGYAAFRVRGGAVINKGESTEGNIGPATANEWPDTDVVDMTVMFSF